jgi:hypothetical protein
MEKYLSDTRFAQHTKQKFQEAQNCGSSGLFIFVQLGSWPLQY